jgi:hypothetical protein
LRSGKLGIGGSLAGEPVLCAPRTRSSASMLVADHSLSPMTANSKIAANSNIKDAWSYHDATKHSYASVRNNLHYLDWANQPLPFKAYTAPEPLPLPREVRQSGVAALSATAESIPADAGAASAVPDLAALAELLYLSAGITRQRKHPGGEIYFRAAACTGALYEVELYVVCGNLADLEAGVYHFSPAEFALRKLRGGDYRGILRDAAAGEPADHRLHLHLLAQCVEISSAHLSPLWLGQRHASGEFAGDGHRSRNARKGNLRIRG